MLLISLVNKVRYLLRIKKDTEVAIISKSQNKVQINEEIRDKEVRLIDADGTMLGIISSRDAQMKANEKELDLVKISPNANPPVCKIMDYGKYIFEQSKREKEAKKKQKVTELKEIRLSANIEEHDFNFKLKNAGKFLENGDKVKVSVKFRGREMNYTVLGKQVLDKFAEAISDIGEVEKKPQLEGKSMAMILSPVSNKKS